MGQTHGRPAGTALAAQCALTTETCLLEAGAEFAEKSWGSRFGGSTEGPTTKVTKGTKKSRISRLWGSKYPDPFVSFVPRWSRTVRVHTFAVGLLSDLGGKQVRAKPPSTRETRSCSAYANSPGGIAAWSGGAGPYMASPSAGIRW